MYVFVVSLESNYLSSLKISKSFIESLKWTGYKVKREAKVDTDSSCVVSDMESRHHETRFTNSLSTPNLNIVKEVFLLLY